MSFSQALSATVTGEKAADSSALISMPSVPSRIFSARMPASRAIWAPTFSSFSYAIFSLIPDYTSGPILRAGWRPPEIPTLK